MKYIPFILKHLRRNWIRSGSTILGSRLCLSKHDSDRMPTPAYFLLC